MDKSLKSIIVTALLRGAIFTTIYFLGVVLIPIEGISHTSTDIALTWAGFTICWFLLALWDRYRKNKKAN